MSDPTASFSKDGSARLADRKGGRPPAGTDARKRQQILAGAALVFKRAGFDTASMDDVAREAGVSKATLYVYFPGKEQLFAAVIAEERDRGVGQILASLASDPPPAETLRAAGMCLANAICQPWVVHAHRIVIGVVERMPEIGQHLYAGGYQRLCAGISDYLEGQVARGRLAIPDPLLAAQQFCDLCQTSLLRPRLYAVHDDAPTPAECEKVVAAAVAMFLAHYGQPAVR